MNVVVDMPLARSHARKSDDKDELPGLAVEPELLEVRGSHGPVDRLQDVVSRAIIALWLPST